MPSFSDFAGYEGFLFCSGGVKTRRRPTALARHCPPLRLQTSLWSLNQKPSAESFSGQIERSAMRKNAQS
jgi:hypothetical protein